MTCSDVIELLDKTIGETVDLHHLDVLLNMKLSIFNTTIGSRKIRLSPNLVLTRETVDFDLLVDVLKKGFQICEDFSKLFENIIEYITAKHTDISYQSKIIKLLNYLVSFSVENNKMYSLFDNLKSEFVFDFLIRALCNTETKARSYETLSLCFTLFSKADQIKCLNAVFDFCSENNNLDIFCALLNRIAHDLIYDKSCCFNHATFFIYIEACISSSVSHLQKQGEYVLSKYVDTIDSSKIKDSWQVFFMLLDIGREKQLHLVTPSLSLFKHVWDLPFLWQKCACKIYLQHSQNTIVNQIAIEILDQRFSGDNLKKIFNILFPAINKDEYTELSCKMFQKLQKFCAGLSKNDLDIVVKELIKISWTPGRFWKVIQNVFSDQNCVNINVDLFQEVIRCAVNLPHVYIRSRCIGYLIHLFRDEKDDGKICKLAISLKSSDEMNFQSFDYLHSEEIVSLVINDLLQSDDNVRVCFLILKNVKRVMFSYLKEHFDTLNLHAPLLLSYINLLHMPCNETLCRETENILLNYFDRFLSEETTETFIEVFKLLLSKFDVNQINMTKIIDELPRQSKEFNQFQIYVAVVLCQEYYLHLHVKLTLIEIEGLIFINFCQDGGRMIELKDSSLCSESINLFFKLNKDYSIDDTKNIIEIFTKIFQSHDNKALYSIYKNLKNLLALSECKNLVIDFINVCHHNILHIKKDKYYTRIVSKFIETIYSEEYLNYNGNNVSVINDYLLEISELNPVIRVDWITYLRSTSIVYPEVCLKPALEIYLQGLVITKKERTEFHVCQEFDENTPKHPLKDNPNHINIYARIIALETLLQTGRKNSDISLRLLRERYMLYFRQRYFPNSKVHLKKLRIVQAILNLVFEEKLSEEQAKDISSFAFDCLLQETNQSCIKQLLNWILILTLKQVAPVLEWIELRRHDISPSALINIMPAINHLMIFGDEKDLVKNLRMALPWTMGAQFKLRVYAQDLIKRIIQHAKERNYENFLNTHGYLEESITSCLECAGDAFVNTMKSDRVFLNDLHPIENKNSPTIFYEIPRLNKVYPTEWQNLYPESMRSLIYSRLSYAIDKYLGDNKNDTEQIIETQPNQMSHIQKKITPWKSSLENKTAEAKSDFILVASLIDKAQNLGGLSRTCEVFGIRTVVFNDANVINDKEFKSLSMSSEAWINVTEIKVKDLMEYISRLQKEGYRVVGAEQTAGSKKLDEFCFPRKTALILGNEKTGISPDLIPLLDECLEIPQFGQTRSLNVHVAGATFIWEYAKQHLVLSAS